MAKFRIGQLVRLTGSKDRPDMNGAIGCVEEPPNHKNLYCVDLPSFPNKHGHTKWRIAEHILRPIDDGDNKTAEDKNKLVFPLTEVTP